MNKHPRVAVNKSKKNLIAAIIITTVFIVLVSGIVLIRTKSAKKAERLSQDTTSLNDVIFGGNKSKEVDLYNKYANANELYRQGEYDSAIGVLRNLTSQSLPDSVVDLAYRLLADVYLAKGNYTDAAATLRSYQKTGYYLNQPSDVKQAITDEIDKIDKGVNTLIERNQKSNVE